MPTLKRLLDKNPRGLNVFKCGYCCLSQIVLKALQSAKEGKEQAGVMIPIPQYPLYSATLSEVNSHQVSSAPCILNTECAYKKDSSAPFLDPCGLSNSNIMAVGPTYHSPEEFLIIPVSYHKYDE